MINLEDETVNSLVNTMRYKMQNIVEIGVHIIYNMELCV